MSMTDSRSRNIYYRRTMCIRHFGVGGQWRTGGVSLTPRHAIAHSKQRNSIITAQYKTALGKQMTKSTFCLNGDRKQCVWARKKCFLSSDFHSQEIKHRQNAYLSPRGFSLSLILVFYFLMLKCIAPKSVLLIILNQV